MDDDQKRMFRSLVTITLGLLLINYIISYFFSSNDNAPANAGMTQQVIKAQQFKSKAALLKENNYYKLANGKLSVYLNKNNMQFENAVLHEFKASPTSEDPITLLSPKGTKEPYYQGAHWLIEKDGVNEQSPTTWVAREETPTSLKLEGVAGGVIFHRTLSLDENYMITFTDTVKNSSRHSVVLRNVSTATQQQPTDTLDQMLLNEGLVGVLDGNYKEISYKDLINNKSLLENSNGGWLGLNDKYWLTAIAYPTSLPVASSGNTSLWQEGKLINVNRQTAEMVLEPDTEHTITYHHYIGPKDVKLLDSYEANLDIPKFDLAVDFGWFSFITKPLLKILAWFNSIFGSMGIAIILLTVLTRASMLPIGLKGQNSMAAMKQLQPEMAALREQYKDDKAKLNQEMMALYKKYKVNPFGGCLPLLLQIPIFFALYKVLSISIEMRHAPFLWVTDLSAPDTTNIFTLFGLIPWSPPSLLHLGIWPIMVGISMYIQQKMTPQAGDAAQARMMSFLPIVLTFVFAGFPVGVLLYWVSNNILTVLQQVLMPKKDIELKAIKDTKWKKPRNQN